MITVPMIPASPDTRRTLSGSFATLLAIVLPIAACSIDVAEPEVTRWQAELVSIPPALERGTVAVVSLSDRSEAGIAITGGEVGVTYAWNIRSGSCDSEGTIFVGEAVYPLLTPGSLGEDEVEQVLAQPLNRNDDYAARIYRVTEADERTPVACGELERRDV